MVQLHPGAPFPTTCILPRDQLDSTDHCCHIFGHTLIVSRRSLAETPRLRSSSREECERSRVCALETCTRCRLTLWLSEGLHGSTQPLVISGEATPSVSGGVFLWPA